MIVGFKKKVRVWEFIKNIKQTFFQSKNGLRINLAPANCQQKES